VVRVRLNSALAAAGVGVLACGLLAAGSVGGPVVGSAGEAPGVPSAVAAATASARPTPAASPPAVAPQAVSSPDTSPSAAPEPVERSVLRTQWAAYASVGPVTLHLPADVIEVVGLHQSGHDGAQPQSPVDSGARIGRMDSRARDTDPYGAADIVVDPTRELRAPVTGTVLRAGSYTLYCDHTDNYLVVEPDARPGWEVKLLHFHGLAVGKGDRVEAGVTVVGSRARVLPFASQVDKHTVAPHWPHVHVEVVDPSVPDRPSGGSCD
jgi:biotin carboxyl carrier protein